MANADRIIDLFHEARARPAGTERERFLSEACGDDVSLQEQIVSLLAADAGDEGIDLLKGIPFSRAEIPLSEKPGDRVGRYKLLEQIGEGGCGVVYMAEQEEPVRRRVALKVIKLGMDTKSVIARFEAERQALAMMDHPNIAKVLDAGATEAGRPYFVMELVRGVRITDYCDQNDLSTGDRLKLFTRVCHAIQHAHQKGIIHRDIKPSNILVTISEPGAPGCPMVIDFGIAKATTDQRLTDKTVFTAFEQFIGTPAYMSPEQAMMTSMDIDTRTDIYALGVLLYELLTGKPPFDARELLSAGLDEMRRIIRETEPQKPSTRLTQLRSRTAANSAGGAALRAPHATLDRDLDWIVMKCLEKDRGRRYGTASDLAMDLERHLKSEPVVACPPTALYRFRKFARRNRAALVMASVLGLAVIVTLVGLLISNRLIIRQKEEKEAALSLALAEKGRADRNLSKAREAVKEFLLMAIDNPLLNSGDFQGLRKELLETAIPFYTEFVRQDRHNPDLEFEQGRAYDDLGFLRDGIGDKEQALADMGQAKEIYQRLADRFPDKPVYRLRLAESCSGRGAVLKDLSRLDAAETEFLQALRLMEGLLAGQDPPSEYRESLARIQGNFGLLLRDAGRLPEAEPLLRDAVATREKLLEQSPESLKLRGQLSTSLLNLGTVLKAAHKSDEATTAFEKILDATDPNAMNLAGGDPPNSAKFQHLRAQAWNNLGIMRNEARQFADAEAAFRESLTIKEKLADTFPSIPEYRQELAASFNNLGTVVMGHKRAEEARAAYERAIQLYQRLCSDSPNETRYAVLLAGSYSNMGRLLGDEGQLEESLPWITKGIKIQEDALRENHRDANARGALFVASWTRAMTLCGLTRYEEAVKDWDRAIELDDGRHLPGLRLKRASTFLSMKDVERAVADAELAAADSGATPNDLYNAACLFSICSQQVPNDAPRAESYAAQAVVILRKALTSGYQDFPRIKTHPDMEAIRSREDFQELIKGLEAPADGREASPK